MDECNENHAMNQKVFHIKYKPLVLAVLVAVVADYIHLQQAVAVAQLDKVMVAQVQDIHLIMVVVVVALVEPEQVVRLLIITVELVV